MSRSHSIALAVLAMAFTLPADAQSPANAQTPGDVVREEQGNRISENIPAIPDALIERLNRYQNTRGAGVAGWTRDGCLLIGTRFAETTQAHRVCEPLGMREQLTFYAEPVSNLVIAPAKSGRDGFVFGKDVGGNEFWQLSWFDFGTRETTLLSDGKRSRNEGPLFSHDGRQFAWSSTARNGTDSDVWVMDVATKRSRPVVVAGGNWSASDFSPDGRSLLVVKYVSVNEAYPGEVDLASGKLTLFPVDGGKAAFGDFRYAPDGKSVYFVSDEPVDGKPSEFRTLRHHQIASGKLDELSASIPWDVDAIDIADDGRHLAYVSNEDGIDKLHVLALPGHREIALPPLPVGVIGGMEFSPDGTRLAITLNTATSPSDAYVIDLAKATLTRWTRSEVGGLDATKFVAPKLELLPAIWNFTSVPAGSVEANESVAR